ncbi:DUF7673 family protein [Methylibium petroleiphilum]|uniref:Uncharacterized protein n=1 Tax=Methylibium petroleiphilum (strain ATCC BAA-1232 / LMG 22953 / PM1) TaxID=420662 RepID=A2SMR5_METPP|nr:hypothetical protein [Methylibium petroleiphilum]ABM96854.1 hypothetical protein Mpe_B0075 [Methylibium petroleiphilum PM1]
MPAPTSRVELEEAGFEALQRLYQVALGDAGQCRFIARFLLGLYNGTRFPFDLTDLRAIDEALFEDCMTVLRMDARLCRQEIHLYFTNGGAKFEQLVRDWNVRDVAKLAATGDGSPRPGPERGVLRHEDDVSARLVSYGNSPGYRDATLTLDCEAIGDNRDAVGTVRLSIHLQHPSTVDVLQHLQHVHAFAWRDWPRRAPLDAKDGEQRPAWLDRPSASLA